MDVAAAAARVEKRQRYREYDRQYSRERREREPEKVRASSRRYRKQHPDRFAEYSRRRYERHREQILEYNREYRGQNPLRGIRRGMVRRCYDARHKNYPHYGGRGITVYEPWRTDFKAFEAWVLASLGPRPGGTYPSGYPMFTIDRIDVDGNYEPGNLRWLSVPDQNANRRRMVAGELAGAPDWTECGEGDPPCPWAGTWEAFDRHWGKKHAPPLSKTG